jgi:hypothetical protein
MAEFMATTASNNARISNHAEVETIISGYFIDPDFHVGVGFDEQTGQPYVFLYGYVWPEAWKLPDGVACDEFDPYTGELYEEGGDGFRQLLQDMAGHLEEPLTVHAVGNTRYWFPLAACEWHVQPGSTDVDINEFQHDEAELIASRTRSS